MSAVDVLKVTAQATALIRRGCRLGCTVWGCTYWRHLANTNESCVCGGDAALCEITLTTCYYYLTHGVCRYKPALEEPVTTSGHLKVMALFQTLVSQQTRFTNYRCRFYMPHHQLLYFEYVEVSFSFACQLHRVDTGMTTRTHQEMR